jgi:hypothetical protein
MNCSRSGSNHLRGGLLCGGANFSVKYDTPRGFLSVGSQ